MIEAECTRCGETFVPHGVTAEDLIHGFREGTDQECGGIGIIQGEWTLGGEEEQWQFDALTKFEEHGKEMPDCSDPDCEFHHPEVREVTHLEAHGQGSMTNCQGCREATN